MNYWDKEHEYKEVKRALNDRWITQKNIRAVHVKMEFIDKNGCCSRDFYWFNPETLRRELKIHKQLEYIDKRISSLQNERKELIKLKEVSEMELKEENA